MNTWSKMISALGGGVNDNGEAGIDANALRILDQEIRDASEELNTARDRLASLMTEHKAIEERVVALRADITRNEGFIIAALEKNDEELAREIAIRVAEFEEFLERDTKTVATRKQEIEVMQSSIVSAERQLRQFKHQIETVKATEAVQRALKVLAQRNDDLDLKPMTARDSLARIRKKEKQSDANINQASKITLNTNDTLLDKKLRDAGITGGKSAKDVLARLKTKAKK